MNLLEIQKAALAYHAKADGTVPTGIVGGIDLFLVAANQAKAMASDTHDFNFQQKLLDVNISTVTGGTLTTAVVHGTQNAVVVKTVLDMGIYDKFGNFIPVEWTTTEESQERQREENRYQHPLYRYPTDAEYHSHTWGQNRITLRGDTIATWPLADPQMPDRNIVLGIDAYVEDDDWTTEDYGTPASGQQSEVAPTTDIWTTKGAQFILWQSICDLNKFFKTFVARQEGNVAEPQERATTALAALVEWDVFKFEQGRRHGR